MNTNIDMTTVITALVGAITTVILHRLGVKVPGLPPSEPKPPVPDAVDVEANDFLTWALAVKAGKLKLDAKDLEAVKVIKQTLADPVFEKAG